MFNEVVVFDIITDLSYYTQDVLRELVPQITPANRHHFCDQPFSQEAEKDDSPGEPLKNMYYLRAPRNTILGIPVSEASGGNYGHYNSPDDIVSLIKSNAVGSPPLNVYYPFFSSHFCLPVKPGETIWTFESGDRNYWMTRVSQPLPAEDPNFTHRERRWEPVRQNPVKVTQGASASDVDRGAFYEKIPSFPLGSSIEVIGSNRYEDPTEALSKDETREVDFKSEYLTFPLLDASSGIQTRSFYDLIYQKNNQAKNINYEPVPRITKRPGDLVLQGSNNSSIVLGTERGWTTLSRPDGNRSNVRDAEDQAIGQKKGIIDIVAGRGRIDQEYDSENVRDKDPAGTTRPRIIENTRKVFETEKNPGLNPDVVSSDANTDQSGHLKHAAEGDPDFVHDASRVYISMRSNPDQLLFGEIGDDPYPMTPQNPQSGTPTNEGSIVNEALDAASIIVKSDEVRIVARHRFADDPVTGSPAINGSIRIVKEGVPDSRDGDGTAVIMMLPDGTIMIDGPKIVIGSGAKADDDGHSEGQQLALGVGATEPLVLGNKLGELLCKFIGAIVQNQATISVGASPNMLNPAVLAAANEVLADLGGTASGNHTPTNNTTLSKLGKTK